jgi:hypothetical protein
MWRATALAALATLLVLVIFNTPNLGAGNTIVSSPVQASPAAPAAYPTWLANPVAPAAPWL